MPTIRTLLSGGELFGVGARQADYTHIDGYEIDGKIAAVSRLNGFDVRTADICQVDYTTLPDADHLHASPVCTRASLANVGAEESDLDIAMADAICRAIRAHKGRTVSIENVWAYREFKSFKKILMQLSISGFIYDFRHLNSADYGVPQTRKRLILRAVRGLDRVPGLRPTHGKRGGILLERWNGWYRAIADILHTLPETTPAPWQLARMPKALRESMLIGTGGWDGGIVHVLKDSPAFTMTATGNQEQIRAFLVQSKNANQEWGKGYWEDDEPSFTITGDHKPSHQPRAYIGGRWVRMDIRALGRFQSVPDDYIGLTPQVNGNGVPPLLARRIMESLRGCYAD